MSTNTSTEEKEKEEKKYQSEPDFEFTLEEMSRRDRKAYSETWYVQQYYEGINGR